MVAEVDCGNLTQCARAAMCIVVCSSVYSGVLCIVLCIRIVVYNFCFLFLACLALCLYLVQGFFVMCLPFDPDLLFSNSGSTQKFGPTDGF